MLEDFRLKVFISVAECGSFTAASRALGISQPAVSQNIAELEKLVGVKLMNRSRSRVELTESGAIFKNQVKSIIDGYRMVDDTFSVPKSILIKNVTLGGSLTNILIVGKRFSDLHAYEDAQAEKIIDAEGMAILPSLFNTHTHAAMTLMRGYGEDLPLKKWLEDYVWPFESRITPEDIRMGSDIAIREMLHSGTTFFSDMYFDIEETIKAVDESGLRAAIGITVMDNHTLSQTEAKKDFVRSWVDPTGGRIQLVMCPHAIYTVNADRLKSTAAFARKNGMRLHIHVAETESEVKDCMREHGTTPVRYLDSLGFLGPDVIAAHCVHVDEKEWKILAKRGVTVSHCPCSNMKLGSGRFPYELAMKSGCRITLGTDGASSNNCLDMLGEMKFAALLAKVNGDPTLLPAGEVFRWATKNGADAFGIDSGEIAAGKLADAILVDLGNSRMQPCNNLISNIVYSADSSCVKYVICDGKIVIRPEVS